MSLGKTCDLSSGASFCPQEHNLNKIGRGSLNDVIYVISICLVVSDKEIFYVSPT